MPSWYTSGNEIIGPEGNPIRLYGVSWFGTETSNYVVHGLWVRNMESMLDQIVSLGFNCLRLPYCNDIFKKGVMPNSIDYNVNPNLQGKTALEVYDLVITTATQKGLYVVLDRHRPTAAGQSELWYTPEVPESVWITDWQYLANKYKDNPSVAGFDLHNEPHGSATWGTGNLTTDWRAAAQRAGNAILEVNPNALIIVEGIQYDADGQSTWWGAALDQVNNKPVSLNLPNKVVYSPHDYGPAIYNQPWFNTPDFPYSLGYFWDNQWGYIAKEGIAPIWVGEFGGRETDTVSKEGQWQNTLVQYIYANKLNYAYWAWNPNSGDTGGILKDDWQTVHQDKITMLQPILNQPKKYQRHSHESEVDS